MPRSAAHLRGRPAEELVPVPPGERPPPPKGARNVVVVVLDSLRFDSLVAAAPTILPRLGPLERRFSYASWTSPSHFNLLMGLLPHPAPTGVFASAWYQQDLGRWQERLQVDAVGFAEMLPSLWLPELLRDRLGYRTGALMSMPVLNPATPLHRGFDTYALAPRHNDLDALVDQLRFDEERPSFWVINTGETHYPYALPEEPEERWPTLHGLRGVIARLGQGRPVHQDEAPRAFDARALEALRARQVYAAAALDRRLERLLDLVPRGTWVIVTSDHGELFGEGGWFGHGPVLHEKVFEVPLVEGLAR